MASIEAAAAKVLLSDSLITEGLRNLLSMAFHSVKVQIMVYGSLAYNDVQLKLWGKNRRKVMPHSNILPTFLVSS